MLDMRLSVDESNVLQDAVFFEKKAAIDVKIAANFKRMNKGIREMTVAAALPPSILASSGRLYKGNQFQHYLPWQASDAIRSFAGEDLFCFRAVMIWGKPFSFNLVIGGKWLETFLPLLTANQRVLEAAGFHFRLQDNPWDWDFSAESHRPASRENWEQMLVEGKTKNWIKLSQSHPLSSFDDLAELGIEAWSLIYSILKK